MVGNRFDAGYQAPETSKLLNYTSLIRDGFAAPFGNRLGERRAHVLYVVHRGALGGHSVARHDRLGAHSMLVQQRRSDRWAFKQLLPIGEKRAAIEIIKRLHGMDERSIVAGFDDCRMEFEVEF